MADRVNAQQELQPDANTRKCVTCKETHIPYSVGTPVGGSQDGWPVQPPPVNYKCMSCRAKAAKA